MPPKLKGLRAVLLAAGLLQALAGAHAHVSLTEPQAVAGSFHKAVLSVTHGCNSPTRSITVFVPPGLTLVRPQAKAQWKVTTRTEAQVPPIEVHGVVFRQRVTQITWTGGPLEDSHYDEFAFVGRLPAEPGKLVFRVLQKCTKGELDWSGPPDSHTPAAELTVLPASKP